ncbi:DEAD/DEAH box helicase family protein, partial [Acinetobacter baumannii]|nr:DEAD/DEAH box helicase family protein [Acinetobacter baumannii]
MVELNMVSNFQHVNPNAINICLTTIQQLHTDLTNPKEGGLTFDDFASFKTVMISDEAHHINSNTKKGKKSNNTDPELPDLEPSW